MQPPETPSNPPAQPDDAEARRNELQAKRQRRLKIMLPVLLVLVFIAYGFTTNFIPSESMLPTLRPGDHIITMRSWLAYPFGRMPARGDIIVFELPRSQDPQAGSAGASGADGWVDPGNPDSSESAPGGRQKLFLFKPHGDVLIKRVVGLPGESVQVQGNQVYINGRPISESYRTTPSDGYVPGVYPYAVDAPLKLGADELLVLGDNPNNSDDGRFWGPLKRSHVIGRFVRVLFHEGASGPNEREARREEGR